jgi:hypothetical protein
MDFKAGDLVQPINFITTGQENVYPNKAYTVIREEKIAGLDCIYLFETGTRRWNKQNFRKLVREPIKIKK